MTTNNPYRGAFLLILAAAGLLVLAAVAGRGDIATATLVLAGTGCFIAGVFLLALNKGEPLDPEIAALLPAQGTVTIATLCADLGVQGDAWFVPEGETVIEIVPVAGTLPEKIGDDYSYITDAGRCAVRLVPACTPLLARLREKHALEVPEEDEALLACIVEVCDDLLEVAGKTEATKDGENIVVTLADYRLLPGCRAVRAASPKCCTMIGCPVCSLLAALAALGLRVPVTIEHVGVDEKRKVLRVILRPAGPAPRGAGPGSSR
ncbi:hypothetical protein F8E02_03955 [Methanoculleus sp. Wushi-C6]|uniref:DUF7982 domain-containing protein n=1 Tax=Methanoculleus caldifontis TaxID=2651577 RepID=A0ABU3X171_9EURY|nr:hypothetical protein [Methanoculleus sp. Wushi-C6]MDV2481176.1 hypothetical protein [Methanoculleus sp. Wushi-C6]